MYIEKMFLFFYINVYFIIFFFYLNYNYPKIHQSNSFCLNKKVVLLNPYKYTYSHINIHMHINTHKYTHTLYIYSRLKITQYID